MIYSIEFHEIPLKSHEIPVVDGLNQVKSLFLDAIPNRKLSPTEIYVVPLIAPFL